MSENYDNRRLDRFFEAGRSLYGCCILGFGAVGLVYADFLQSLQPVPETMLGYDALAVVNGLVLAAAGLAVLLDRRAIQAAGLVIAIFVAGILILHIPSAITQPTLLRSPWWIRTFESTALIGGAAVLAGSSFELRREMWIRIGRIAFGLSLPVFGVLHLIYLEATASLVPPWYPWPLFWAFVTGLAQIAAGLSIAVGFRARLAAILAGAMYALWALTLHVPRIWCSSWRSCSLLEMPGGEQALRAEITSLFVVIGMAGAAWMVAARSADSGSVL